MGDRWGDEGPPPEAYSRVSDPTRYAGLHEIAREVVADLELRFDVARTDSTEPDDRGPGDVPVLSLVPHDRTAAPLAIVLTSSPGLLVRAGHTSRTSIPSCGCDACDETLADSTELLIDHVTDIATLGFTERVVRDWGWWHELHYPGAAGSGGGRARLERAQARRLRDTLPGAGITWVPWTPRALTTPDLDLRNLPEVQRRVVDHVVKAMFRPGELDTAQVQVDHWADDPAADEAPGLIVLFTAQDGDQVDQPLTVTGPRWSTAAQLVDDLANSVEDWISETTYAWGEQRPRPPRPDP